MRPISEVQPGDVNANGVACLSEPAEQPDGRWTVIVRYPNGRRAVVDLDSADSDFEVL